VWALTRVLILGIDSAEPLQIESWIKELPTMRQLYETYYRRVQSTVPPITIPAWLTAFSGLNPGYFGLYDLRYRVPGTYTDYRLYSYRVVEHIDFIWNRASKRGLKTVLCFVPGTYPPPRIRGYVVADFFTPDTSSDFTWPRELKEEVLNVVGGEDQYIIDVYDYRRIEPRKLYRKLIEKIEHDFKILKYLLRTKDWDLAICVLMSVDRAQHTLWKYFDREHPRYVEDPELKYGLLNLYKKIDEELSNLVTQLPRDTVVIVMSDHGAKRMYARINVNEVLIQERFLKLKEKPSKPMTLKQLDEKKLIDWERTIAWSWGAYVGQVWINLEGREPKGVVKRSEYEDICRQVADALSKVRDPNGRKLNNVVHYKWNAYTGPKTTYMPDITLYFDNLHYGANEMVGFNTVYSLETAKGPDDSNHGEYAIFMCSEKPPQEVGKLEDVEKILEQILELQPP